MKPSHRATTSQATSSRWHKSNASSRSRAYRKSGFRHKKQQRHSDQLGIQIDRGIFDQDVTVDPREVERLREQVILNKCLKEASDEEDM